MVEARRGNTKEMQTKEGCHDQICVADTSLWWKETHLAITSHFTSNFLSSSDSKFSMFTTDYDLSSHAACLQGKITLTKEHKYLVCLCHKSEVTF